MTRVVAMTGVTGFIGWNVARRFLANGWRVRALVRPESSRPVPDGVERVTTPLRETDVIAACRDVGLIVHMAGAVGTRTAEEFLESNVNATGEVARAAQRLNVRLVHMSSLGVTGPGSPDNPPTEDDPPRPINLYGESKRLGEESVAAVVGLDWAIVRPTLVYGPRDRLFLQLFKLARRGFFPIPGTAARYNVIHVDDLARGVEAVAMSTLSREILFLGHPDHVSISDLMSRLATVFGRRFRPLVLPKMALRVAAELGSAGRAIGLPMPIDRARWKELDAPGFVCRVDKARVRLGFVAEMDLSEGLTTTARWYEENGWLRGSE